MNKTFEIWYDQKRNQFWLRRDQGTHWHSITVDLHNVSAKERLNPQKYDHVLVDEIDINPYE